MSIFKKDCPECAAPNSVDAVRCDCGYCFDPGALAGADAAEYAQEQDQLYVDYLAARIVQAEAELVVAREHAKADGENTNKAAQALLAEQALGALQAEMKQLSLRLSSRPQPKTTFNKKSAPVKAPTPLSFAKPAPKQKPAPVVPLQAKKPAAEKPTRERNTAPSPAPAKPAAPIVAAAPVKMPAPKKAPVQTRREAPRPVESKPKAAPIVKPLPPPPAPPAAPKPIVQVAPAPTKPVAPIVAKQTATPNADFRNLQAKKAAAVLTKSKPANVVTEPATPTSPVAKAPVVQAKSTPLGPKSTTTQECPSCTATVALNEARCRCGYVFSKAEQAMPDITLPGLAAVSLSDTQECPNCTATLAAEAKQCRCGYVLVSETEQVPALSLDAGALSILTEGVGSPRTSRRR